MKITEKHVRKIIREMLAGGESSLTAAGLDSREIALTLAAIEGDDMDFYGSTAYEKLFVYYQDEMPYGTQKARTGDPIVWILDQLESEGVNEGILREAGEDVSNADFAKGLKTGAADLASSIPPKLNDDFASAMKGLAALAQFDKSKFEKIKGFIDNAAGPALEKAEKGEKPDETDKEKA